MFKVIYGGLSEDKKTKLFSDIEDADDFAFSNNARIYRKTSKGWVFYYGYDAAPMTVVGNRNINEIELNGVFQDLGDGNYTIIK